MITALSAVEQLWLIVLLNATRIISKAYFTVLIELWFFGTFTEIRYAGAMEWHLKQEGVKFVDYEKKYATKLRCYIREHVKAVASYYSMEVEYLNYNVRKEDYVAKKLETRGRRPGLVCVLSAMESLPDLQSEKR